MPAYEELTATDLIRHWRQLVNGNNAAGRDGALLKKFLEHTSPIKVLLGMYRYRNVRTISIPQFLRETENWIEDDEQIARIELAIFVAHKIPSDYYIWKDNKDDETPESFNYANKALSNLTAWADGILA